MSQVAKHCIELEWKEISLDLNTIEAWMRANAGEHYCGNSAGAKLQLWFLEEPAQDVKELIELHWATIDETSDEAKNYMANEDRAASQAAATAAAKASAQAKLKKLGLTEAEVLAILGA